MFFKSVIDAVRKVGNEDNFIQIQETNQQKLFETLDNMIVRPRVDALDTF
jgi:hypothetical protein